MRTQRTYVIETPRGHCKTDFATVADDAAVDPRGRATRDTLGRSARKVAQSLPAAAQAPTPRKLVQAASDFDHLRSKVWSPVTRTAPMQNAQNRIKKNSKVHLAVQVATRGPLIACLDHRKKARKPPTA